MKIYLMAIIFVKRNETFVYFAFLCFSHIFELLLLEVFFLFSYFQYNLLVAVRSFLERMKKQKYDECVGLSGSNFV